jgi:hypothetical protein
MTRRLLGALIVAAGAAIVTTPAQAQPIPSGSYQRSCEAISMNGTTLRATCETANGDRSTSRLDDVDECDGDIGNNDGRLTCARAPVRDTQTDDRNDDRPPSGSYQDSCRQERVSDGDLSASCADENGRVHRTRMQDYSSCRGDISNNNGTLQCEQDRTANNNEGDDEAVPAGSWRVSCRDDRVSRNVLIAECRNQAGRWIVSSVNLRACTQGVSNDNGQLVCARSPARGWRVSLYLNTNYRGGGQTFTSDIPDLARYGYANRISSVYIRSGAWQLCTQAYYGGQCVTVRSAATPNLARLGINDRVRSVRRVR